MSFAKFMRLVSRDQSRLSMAIVWFSVSMSQGGRHQPHQMRTQSSRSPSFGPENSLSLTPNAVPAPTARSATENALRQLMPLAACRRKNHISRQEWPPTRSIRVSTPSTEDALSAFSDPNHAQFRLSASSMQSPGLIRRRPVSPPGDRARWALYAISPGFLAKRFGQSPI